MAAPDYVPTPLEPVRTYSSPPRRPGSWMANRPGDLHGRQPEGPQLGSPGPDQGFALTIAEGFRYRLSLSEGEHAGDALAGAAAVGLKRASLYGRAPTVHDVEIGLAVWGLMNPKAPKELVTLRQEMFEEAHHPHHYSKLRAIADAVPAEGLMRPHQEILNEVASNWRSMIVA